jgi:peptide/nickel transport system substrate-binding protein
MRSKTAVAAVAVGTALVLALAACGKSTTSSSSNNNSGNTTPVANAGVDKVFAPSTQKGGTLRFANSADWDSLDPADTYYGYSWDFIRYYGRSLVMFNTVPGPDGNKLVPDLAQSLGTPSDGGKTWTYKLRPGLKYEDGSAITSKDVKYAVERSLDKDVFPDGPSYFNLYLDLQGYTSPYKDSDPNKLGLKAIETPDDQTIVFHLNQAFSDFDYFAMLPQTIPVPAAKDTGAKYKDHVLSSGPYMFSENNAGKNFTLVRNPNWDPKTDPHRAALPDKITVELNANADDIDNRLISGDLDVGVEGTGVQTAAQARILADPTLKTRTDQASLARLWYAAINPDVAPLNNVDCRKAIEYAADHEGYLRAYGGSAGGTIATNLQPPQLPGATSVDLYNVKSHPNGDDDMAKQELAKCGQPNGFSINISYRAERPKEKATAESLQQSLAKVGINLTLKPYPSGDYYSLYAGKPDFAKQNNLGLMITGWGADWPDGFGFLSEIIDSRTIHASGGNYNLSVKDPTVDGLIDKALTTTDTNARNAIWAQADKQVMEDAVDLPGVWAGVLLYRPPTLTNVFVNDGLGGFYDFVQLGVKQ